LQFALYLTNFAGGNLGRIWRDAFRTWSLV